MPVSPYAKKLAKDNNISLDSLLGKGSGLENRVIA
jgi:pyruvate/2-oxoglutarate dehydrogenase complex dihydrolipoamide acyltransferase (E2) component